MSSYGVTDSGFVNKTTADIQSDLEDDLKSAFGQGVDLTADSVLGQITGIVAGALGDGWQALQGSYSSLDPDVASGAALDRVCALTGTARNAAARSTATIVCTGTSAAVLSEGTQVSQETSEDVFESTAEGTLASATAWANSTAYAVDDTVTNSSNIYRCTVAGTSAGSGGPTGTDFDTTITDGGATWRFLGAGTYFADIPFRSIDYGAVSGPAGTLNTIETPVSGWSACANPADATLGNDLETDAALRLRRLEELGAQGEATFEAILAAVAAVDGVDSVYLYENDSEFTDSDGRPPNSIEVVVDLETPGDATIQQAVGDAIFASKAAGVNTFGFSGQDVSVTVDDSQGDSHTINFTEVEVVDIYIDITVTTNTDAAEGAVYPSDGDTQVAAALAAQGNTLGAGDNVIAERIKAEAFEVSGVTDITSYDIDTSASPSGTANISITTRQVASFDTGNINVTS